MRLFVCQIVLLHVEEVVRQFVDVPLLLFHCHYLFGLLFYRWRRRNRTSLWLRWQLPQIALCPACFQKLTRLLLLQDAACCSPWRCALVVQVELFRLVLVVLHQHRILLHFLMRIILLNSRTRSHALVSFCLLRRVLVFVLGDLVVSFALVRAPILFIFKYRCLRNRLHDIVLKPLVLAFHRRAAAGGTPLHRRRLLVLHRRRRLVLLGQSRWYFAMHILIHETASISFDLSGNCLFLLVSLKRIRLFRERGTSHRLRNWPRIR